MANATMRNTEQTRTDDETEAAPTVDEDDITEIHETLKSERRRHTMRALANFGSMHKKELARYVAAYELGKHPDELEEQEHKRVVVSLHQVHLPYLDKRRYVVWKESTNMVALGPRRDLLLRHIRGIKTRGEGGDGDDERPQSVVGRMAEGAASFF